MIKSELEIDVVYYETDQMGIVHHSNYIRYFECGRSDMMAKAGIPIDKIEAAGVVLPVISVECRYRMPAKMGDRIRVVTMIDKVPMAKLVIRNEIYGPSGSLLCEGKVVLGFLDGQTRRPVRCPEMLVKVFEERLCEHIND